MIRKKKEKESLSAYSPFCAFIAFLVVFTFFTSCLSGAFSSFAANTAAAADSAVISVKTLRAKPGDTVTVQVTVDPKEGFCGFAVALEYDTGILQFDKGSLTASRDYLPDYTGESPKYAATNTEGKCGYPVLFQCTLNPSYPPIDEKCTLVQATFQISSSAKEGVYPITPHIDCTGGCYYTMGNHSKTVNLPAVMQTGYLLIGNVSLPSDDPEPPIPSGGEDGEDKNSGDSVDPSKDPIPPFPGVDPLPPDDTSPDGQGNDGEDHGDGNSGGDKNDQSSDLSPVTPPSPNNGNGNSNGNGGGEDEKNSGDPAVIPGTDGTDKDSDKTDLPSDGSLSGNDNQKDLSSDDGKNDPLTSDTKQNGTVEKEPKEQKGFSAVTVTVIILLLLLVAIVCVALVLMSKPKLQARFLAFFRKK